MEGFMQQIFNNPIKMPRVDARKHFQLIFKESTYDIDASEVFAQLKSLFTQ